MGGYYDASYANFASSLYTEIRREAFGEDLGQNSWITAPELSRFIDWLQLKPGCRALDVACGSGGPALRLVASTGCQILGIDVHEQAIANANDLAGTKGLAERARFERHDASRALPFPSATFEGVLCIDAINHLPDRSLVLSEWARVLKPGGRLVFTDPLVVTGPLTSVEIAIRSSVGFMLFVPRGEDDRLLLDAGLQLLQVVDLTQQVVDVAKRRRTARETRAAALRKIEGDATFQGQQEFLRVAETIARERRLSRFAFLAGKPH